MEGWPGCGLSQLASKAEIMSGDILTYSAEFNHFWIDFDVKLRPSIEATKAYWPPQVPDFVFAVADIWLRLPESRHLVIDELGAGNLIETLSTFSERLNRLFTPMDIEKMIPCGGWGVWMQGYWRRIEDECQKLDDEAIYSALDSVSMIEGLDGRIAAYRYGGISIIETSVPTRATSSVNPINVWSGFNFEAMGIELIRIRQQMRAEIKKMLV